jgi:hypothetical protein
MEEPEENSLGICSEPFVRDEIAIREWLVHHEYSDRRLIPQLYCPLCRPLNYERRIQEFQDRKASPKRSKTRAKHAGLALREKARRKKIQKDS